MEACTNRLSLAGSGAIGPLTPSPRIQGLVVSRHGVGLQGPPRFPGGLLSFLAALGLCLANAGPALLRPLIAPKGPWRLKILFLHGSDNGTDVIGLINQFLAQRLQSG
jgi:hypothetical protein